MRKKGHGEAHSVVIFRHSALCGVEFCFHGHEMDLLTLDTGLLQGEK